MSVLPDIWITVSEEPDVLIQEFEQIARSSTHIKEVQAEYNFYIQGLHILNVRPKHDSGQIGLYGQLLTTRVSKTGQKRLDIEVRAEQWMPKPPSRETYVAEAKRIIAPILQKYNQQKKTRYRLFVQKSKENTLPKLPEASKAKFDAFSLLANKRTLHPLDWEHFYQFIRYSHARRLNLEATELAMLLRSSGFSQHQADKLSSIYEHGRGILSC